MQNNNASCIFDIAPVKVHTLIIGSGAAGLNAAVQLYRRGMEDILVITEGLDMGTSINTGSDKQTYYKLGMCGTGSDSVLDMARSYFDGGGMHGDLALVEAALSPRCFSNLVELGVPFPHDRYGQFVGYKTDHDPRQRATSMGPYTSREMCLALTAEVRRLGIEVREKRLAVSLLVTGSGEEKRAVGALVMDMNGTSDGTTLNLESYMAENVVLAVGGPGGLYQSSVYPEVHTGSIGLALMAGAKAQGLPESQFGLASIKYRWNVSGTYMQVIPRFVSTARDGSDECEFLHAYYDSASDMCFRIFLKGYQWPFDPGKAINGSSLIDILVFIETVIRGRRVFLDFRRNPAGFSFADLSPEAAEYLERSGAVHDTPIARLLHMNPDAVELYQEHGIDIEREPLEIAVCAQHNNGGLAGNLWWESINIKHLFPVGEVNGSHGVYRPGGSALNSGQVGALRAAEYIAERYSGWSVSREEFTAVTAAATGELNAWIHRASRAVTNWKDFLYELRARTSRAAGCIRSLADLEKAVTEAQIQWAEMRDMGCAFCGSEELADVLQTRQLCFAHLVYLEAVRFAVRSGVGSRGSAMTLGASGHAIHPELGEEWRLLPEDIAFRQKVMETDVNMNGKINSRWVERRLLPDEEGWFENTWAAYRKGEIYE